MACSGPAGKWMFGKKKFEIIPNAIEIENLKLITAYEKAHNLNQ